MKLKELSGKPYTWYLTELIQQKDALLAMKESIIDPVRKFMSGPQKGIFDNACKFVQNQEPNFDYIENEGATQIVDTLTDPECFKGNRMQQVKIQVESLQDKITKQVGVEISSAKDAVTALKERLLSMPEFSLLTAEKQDQITKPFNAFLEAIERQKWIAKIRDTLRRFEDSDYQRLLSQVASWAQPAPIPTPSSANDTTQAPKQGREIEAATSKSESCIEYVSSRAVRVSFHKAWLADESDVERYLESMREALLIEIRKGKRIQI